jgi:hypothetical protein
LKSSELGLFVLVIFLASAAVIVGVGSTSFYSHNTGEVISIGNNLNFPAKR